MERKFWAQRRDKRVGPFASREAAIDAFRATFPHKGPDYMRIARKNQPSTGYGESGPHFSIEWHDA
jgi:hypothetical protein